MIELNNLTGALGKPFVTSSKLWAPDEAHWTGRVAASIPKIVGDKTYVVHDGLCPSSNWGKRSIIPTTSYLQSWNELMRDTAGNPLDPHEVLKLLTENLPKPTAICIELRESQVRLTMVIHDGRVPLALARRVLIPKSKLAIHKTIYRLDYPDEMSHQHKIMRDDILISQPVFRNLVRLYDRIGINTIHLTAGWSAGSAIWPKFGFRPRRRIRWQYLKVGLRRRHSRFPHLEKSVTNKAFLCAIKDDDPKSIFKVSDLKFRDFNELNHANTEKKYPHDLNGYLLQGWRWAGILPMCDSLARCRMESYLARKGFGI